jgi:3-oxoacyl-[acyl-carrier protein] reductase
MRNVIVTAGSRGLGLAIARRLAGCGYRAIVVARSMSEGLLVARQESGSAEDGEDLVPFISFDLAETGEIPELVKRLRQRFGPIYGLVNNAGISTEGLLAMTPVEQIEKVVQVNTIAPMVLTRSVVRGMMADSGGRIIIIISSITAFTGYSGLAVYAATKASMVGFTRSLAREVGSMGILVNAVAPGFLATELTDGMTEAERETIKRWSALKRFAEVEDVADAVEFLLGDRAKSITGTVLTIAARSTA